MGFEFFNLTMHSCNLTFRDIKIMLDPNNSSLVHGINISGNLFNECDKIGILLMRFHILRLLGIQLWMNLI